MPLPCLLTMQLEKLRPCGRDKSVNRALWIDYSKVLSHWAAPGLLGLQAAGAKQFGWHHKSQRPLPPTPHVLWRNSVHLPRLGSGDWRLGQSSFCVSFLILVPVWRCCFLRPQSPCLSPDAHPYHCKSDHSTATSHFPSRALGFHCQESLKDAAPVQEGCWRYLGPPGVHDYREVVWLLEACFCLLDDLCSGQEHLASDHSAKEDQTR